MRDGQTNKRTRKDSATQPLDAGRSFAIIIWIYFSIDLSSSTKISTKSKRAMLPRGYHLPFIMADAHLKSDNPYQEMTAELLSY